jgi:hypothetical protein
MVTCPTGEKRMYRNPTDTFGKKIMISAPVLGLAYLEQARGQRCNAV